MPNDDLSEEIQLLRKQLGELQKQQDTHAPPVGSSEDEEPQEAKPSTPDSAEAIDKESALSEDLVNQFRDLLDSIDKDIKDAKPTTLLIVFALGVLVGRL
ncbi:hypothetical protein N9H39_03845 [Gammaproteobacteria bacterium]|nr:hypothetical protein [Gammaproteobacteria bacterium]